MKHPTIAKRWADEFPGQHNLPEHKGDKKEHGGKDESKKEASSEGPLMTMNFGEQIVDACQAAATAIEQTRTELNEKCAADRAYQEKIASVVDLCARYGSIDDVAEQRKWLANELTTPLGALGVIEKMAAQDPGVPTTVIGASEVDASGRPASGRTKKADWSSQTSPFVGRRSADEADSWKNFAASVGVG